MIPFEVNDSILNKKSKIYQKILDLNHNTPYSDVDNIPDSILDKTLGIVELPSIQCTYTENGNTFSKSFFSSSICYNGLTFNDDIYYFIYSVDNVILRGFTLKDFEVNLYFDNLLTNQREERINQLL